MSKKLKVCMLTPYFHPHTGGTEKYVRDLSAELVKQGHDVTVISNNVPKEKNAPATETLDGIKVIRLKAIDYIYLPSSMEFNLDMVKGFDVLHAHAPAISFVRAVRNAGIPLVVTYHCDTVMFDKVFGMPTPEWFKWGFEFVTSNYNKLWLKAADEIINTSDSYASSSPVLKQFHPNVIPIGMHCEAFDKIIAARGFNETTKKKNQILFLGRLASNKGVEYLIRALNIVVRKFPDTQLVISGEGEEKPHLLALIKELELEKAVKWEGNLNLEKIVDFYSNSLVYVLPSINRLEAFGIVQLEAMACRTAVIASDIPGVNSVMNPGETGLLVPKMNPEALAEALMKLLGNPQLAIEMGKAGRALLEKKYSWPLIAEKVIAVYEKAIAKRAKKK